MTSCAFCGRENEAESRFCIDCGKPVHPSAARVGPAYVPRPSGGQPRPHSAPLVTVRSSASSAPATRVAEKTVACLRCAKPVTPALPFCGHCGTRVVTNVTETGCAKCGAPYTKGVDLFCARCGQDLKQRISAETPNPNGTQELTAAPTPAGPRLALIGESREVIEVYTLERSEAVIGRGDADITFPDDVFLSPLHARLDLRGGQLWVRDLGSRNGSWVFLDAPARLSDCDLILVGSQLLRFRRLGYPGPHPPEADATRRMGSSTPTADVAVLEQLRADGSVRDVFHLSPGRSVAIGREVGDWIFPYDSTMSRKHAEIRPEGSEFFVHDTNSRNGVAMAVRGERPLNTAQRLLVGNQILRLESV